MKAAAMLPRGAAGVALRQAEALRSKRSTPQRKSIGSRAL